MTSEPVAAQYCEVFPGGAVACHLCPQECFIQPGGYGVCGVRKNQDGVLVARSYGKIAASALDPIEKKPLYHFFPGRQIFSIGGYGCNLHCVFCQNSPISQFESPTVKASPRGIGLEAKQNNSIGVAYTYNEPGIAIEYLMDCAREVKKNGGKNVMVTNGFINQKPLRDLLPYIDAMNVDIKAFNNDFYKRMCKGKLEPVLETVKTAVGQTHVELTTLLIPNENDAVPELEDLSKWIADNCGVSVPCHLTAYHPSYRYDGRPTTAAHLMHAYDIFRSALRYVYLGNLPVEGAGDTICFACGNRVIRRHGFSVDCGGMRPDGACAACGTGNNIVLT